MTLALGSPYPSYVPVGGARVAVATGWRENVEADSIDLDSTGGRLRALSLWFAGPDGSVPAVVADHAPEALSAAIAWHEEAMRCMPYGAPGTGARRHQRRPVLDWSADAAIVAADFQRYYRIDLSDPSAEMHWYRFCALLLGLMRYDGSLTGQAAYARSPHPGAKGPERKRLGRLAEVWALPPTDAELREMARARF